MTKNKLIPPSLMTRPDFPTTYQKATINEQSLAPSPIFSGIGRGCANHVCVLACGDSGDSFALLEEDFWLNASVADVRTELDRGADVNARYISDLTPLHYAAASNEEPAVVALLLDRSADIRTKDHIGYTACQLAGLNIDIGTEVLRQLCR